MRLGHAVLREHVVHVEVRADLERHLQRQRAVVGVGRLHVDALFDAVDLLLERRRDRRFDVGGARADERRGDLDHRRARSRGTARSAGRASRRAPSSTVMIEMHHRHDRPVDEEAGHGLLRLAGGLGRAAAAPAPASAWCARSCRRGRAGGLRRRPARRASAPPRSPRASRRADRP